MHPLDKFIRDKLAGKKHPLREAYLSDLEARLDQQDRRKKRRYLLLIPLFFLAAALAIFIAMPQLRPFETEIAMKQDSDEASDQPDLKKTLDLKSKHNRAETNDKTDAHTLNPAIDESSQELYRQEQWDSEYVNRSNTSNSSAPYRQNDDRTVEQVTAPAQKQSPGARIAGEGRNNNEERLQEMPSTGFKRETQIAPTQPVDKASGAEFSGQVRSATDPEGQIANARTRIYPGSIAALPPLPPAGTFAAKPETVIEVGVPEMRRRNWGLGAGIVNIVRRSSALQDDRQGSAIGMHLFFHTKLFRRFRLQTQAGFLYHDGGFSYVKESGSTTYGFGFRNNTQTLELERIWNLTLDQRVLYQIHRHEFGAGIGLQYVVSGFGTVTYSTDSQLEESRTQSSEKGRVSLEQVNRWPLDLLAHYGFAFSDRMRVNLGLRYHLRGMTIVSDDAGFRNTGRENRISPTITFQYHLINPK